jgi:hypothetical protein
MFSVAQWCVCADQSLSLLWKASPDPRTTGYVLVYGSASGVYNQSTNVGNITEATVSGLQEGRTYYFAVFACGGDSLQSELSNEVSYQRAATTTTPMVSWPNPAEITYGTPLGPQQLNATANLAGTFVYDPPAGKVLNTGASQQLTAIFLPNATVNASPVTNAVSLDVKPARLQITANSTTRLQGTGNPLFTATWEGWMNGDTPATLSSPITFTTPAAPSSPPGTYPIVVTSGTNPNYTIVYVNGTLTVTSPAPVSLTLSPPSVNLNPGQSTAFTLTAASANGTKTNASAAAKWSSSNPAIASVSASGLVKAISKGRATIVTSFGGLTASASVSVVAKANPKGRPGFESTLVSLSVAPGVGERTPVTLTLSGLPGTMCQVLASPDLIDWQPVFAATLSEHTISFTDPDCAASARFYRVASDTNAEER